MGICSPKLSSKKIKLSGGAAQTKGLVAPGALLTLSILRLNKVPAPSSGVKSSEKAEMRRVLSVPGPVLRTFEETFQFVEVSPAGSTCGVAKPTTAESKVKSPWKPIRLRPPVVVESMRVVVNGSMIMVPKGTELSKVSIGKDTVIPGAPRGAAGGSGGKNALCRGANGTASGG